MQRALIYTRVSTDEQADKGFSLPHQKDMLEKYCHFKNIDIIKHFQEDYSAKNFDRPEFNKLMAFIKANRGKIDLVLFTRWDRFSRNQEAALKIIRELKKYGVEVNSIEQPLDLSQPESKVMLAIYLSIPEVENDKNSLRTIDGMRRARLEGCYTGKAPIGYKNHRDINNKSTLVFSDKAPLVKEAFILYSKGIYSLEEVRRRLAKKGLNISKQQFNNMIKSVLYTGKIFISAYGKENDQIVNGLHEPIIDEELYNKVQNLLKSNRKQPINKNIKIEELPLRGYLICRECGGNLTGSGSKSRSGDKHYYYHCQKGCKERFRADIANKSFEQLLASLEINDPVIELYKVIMKDIYKKYEGDNQTEINKLLKEKEKFKNLRINAEDKYFNGDIDKQKYNDVNNRYERKIMEINGKIAELNLSYSGYSKYLNEGLPILTNLTYYYKNASIELKQKLIGSIFPEKLIFENKNYRTIKMNEVLNLILKNSNDLGVSDTKKGQHLRQPLLLSSPGRT